jgi:anti-sigma factor RsiW
MTASDTDPNLLVHAYLDGELDTANALAVEQMIARDPELAAERDRVQALQLLLHERLPPEMPPPALRARIEAAAGLRPRRFRPARPSWMALAASVALAAIISSAGTLVAINPPPGKTTADAVVADHIRALMAPQPIDVASSDRHTVKPWFNGRIPETPRVLDLSKYDFPLAGGRLDVIGRTPVPTLVYQHRKHVISLTAVPAPGSQDAAPVNRTDDGYNLVTWTLGGVTYWAISDLAAAELTHFAELFRTTPADG